MIMNRVQSDKPFTALSKFGIDFMNKFQSSQTNAPILEDLSCLHENVR